MARIDKGRGSSVEQFEKDAKAILWRRIQGKNKARPDYDKWKTRIAEISVQEGISRCEAVIKASQEHSCLAPLMNEYDFELYGVIGTPNIMEGKGGIVCRNEELSYRENLRWAIDAAGEFQRSREHPVECPNNSAWYLFTQAILDPKDFLAKLGQIEVKASEKDVLTEDTRRHSRQSIKDLDDQLAVLQDSDEGEKE